MPLYSARDEHWKQRFLRSLKTVREEPLSDPSSTDDGPLRVLFVCSRNRWRSPTAERIWRSHPKLSVRSAGVSPNARRPVTESDLQWAEVVFVMEAKHKARLTASHPRALEHKPIFVLDVPDEYKYMDPALVEELTTSVGSILGLE